MVWAALLLPGTGSARQLPFVTAADDESGTPGLPGQTAGEHAVVSGTVATIVTV